MRGLKTPRSLGANRLDTWWKVGTRPPGHLRARPAQDVRSVASSTKGFYRVGLWRPSTATGAVAVRSFATAKQSQVRRRALEPTVDAIDVALIVVLGMAAWAVWLHGQVLRYHPPGGARPRRLPLPDCVAEVGHPLRRLGADRLQGHAARVHPLEQADSGAEHHG